MKENWNTAHPTEVNLNADLLAAGLLKIKEDVRFQSIHSWLIVRNGKLVFEEYFAGYEAEDLHETQSVTKSIQSLLIGIAIDKGFIRSVNEPIIQYFPDYQQLDWSNDKDKITIRHLLTMTAGLEWNEGQVSYNQTFTNDANLQMYSEDWLLYALAKPMQVSPGTRFLYSSANPILLSKILFESTKMPPLEFAYEYLFKPLGINDFSYQQNRKLPEILADIDLKPRDLAKIGQLILNQGKWKNKPIISNHWLQKSIQKQLNLGDGLDYGYFWWLSSEINPISRWNELNSSPLVSFNSSKPSNSNNQGLIYAWGIGGQHIFIFPDYQLLTIFTGGNYSLRQAPEPFELVEEFVLKAIR